MFTRKNFFLKTGIIAFIAISFHLSLNAQTPTPGPEPEWRIEDWLMVDWNGTHGNPVQQEDSGDEWWYNHTKIYENGVHVGYVTCGYGTWDDADVPYNTQNNCYELKPFAYPLNDPTSTQNCQRFETQNDVSGKTFQTLARYDLAENMVWCKSYNQGEFFKVIQDSDGNLLAIGSTNFVKDLNGNPISYNPSTANPSGSTVSCSTEGEYSPKMNVVKTDINGNVTWNYIYNMPDAYTSGWLTNGASGRSLIEYDNGYRLVGVSNGKGFMVQTDKNGLVSGTVGKQVYSVAHPTRPHNYLSITLDDIKKSATGHLAVTGYALDHQG